MPRKPLICLLAALLLLAACGAPSAAGTPAATVALATVAPAATQVMTATAAPTESATGATALAITAPVVTQAAPTPAATGQAAAATVQPPTTCTPGALTPAETEGPYYKANPPENSNLVQPGMAGTKLTVTGYVFDAQCRPVPGARVDFWQADSQGQYDNSGYTLRGYQLTDGQGRYAVETVVPGLSPGRTRHIHVKITAPGGATLTTQLYFPGEAANNRDGIFDPKMIMQVQKTTDGEVGTFNFVIQG